MKRQAVAEKPDTSPKEDPSLKPILRSMALEIVIYLPLVTVYTIIVFALAKDQLLQIYYEMPTMYAFITLLVILAQGVLLEALTSWLLRKIGLRH